MRVTLNGIKRVGYNNWKARGRWLNKRVHIWSAEHRAWWRSWSSGYTDDLGQAGIYNFWAAWEGTKHCGPEKRIEFVEVAS